MNQGVMYFICSGSKEHLRKGAIEIFNVHLTNNIKLEVEWIPQSANEYADIISRIIDYDSWSLDSHFLDAIWGLYITKICTTPRFHSQFWSLGSVAVNTFTINWDKEVNRWVPPLHLVCCTLVVPMWKSAPFWLILYLGGEH